MLERPGQCGGALVPGAGEVAERVEEEVVGCCGEVVGEELGCGC